MPTIPIQHLKAHPAQMRTTYDLEALAALTLQLYERGLDPWQPILASPNPGLNRGDDGDGDSGDGYHIVSGHRRHMAQLLAFALRDWAADHPETEITIEVVRTMLATLVESLGALDKVIAALLGKYGAEEIPFVLFEGSQKAEILTLQAANYGSEQPDMLGVAHSFRQAVEAGATPAEIARNSGQHVNFVRNHLALADIPPELAQRIAAGELPMSIATAVADLPEPQRSGLAIFILANSAAGAGQAGGLTARSIKECAATLKKWPGLQQPLLVKHQSQRNIARALVRLWGQVREAYPADAYAAAAMFIYRGLHDEPWGSQEKLALWFQALGGDTYFVDGRIHWPAIVAYLLPELSCRHCPIAQLPQQLLRGDLSQGQGGPLGMPCRTAPAVSAAAAPAGESGDTSERCLHGLAPGDPFDVRVPWGWSRHPGVVQEGGDYRVKRYADLLTAWQAQAAQEQAEDQAEDQAEAEAGTAHLPEKPNDQTAANPNTPSPPPPAAPVAKQRAQIADFMQRHTQLAANHPFATPCGRCRHRLERSPTKDESVPPCAWAGRLRNVSFKLLAATDPPASGNGHRPVPVCRQFAPNQPWPDLIPAHPAPPGIPRDWLKAQLLQLVKEANRHGRERNAFEFLTGRPMGSSENYSDWFEQQLAAQGGELSDVQLFTLLVWAHAEWPRAQGQPFLLPLQSHAAQFDTYREQPWPAYELPPAGSGE